MYMFLQIPSVYLPWHRTNHRIGHQDGLLGHTWSRSSWSCLDEASVALGHLPLSSASGLMKHIILLMKFAIQLTFANGQVVKIPCRDPVWLHRWHTQACWVGSQWSTLGRRAFAADARLPLVDSADPLALHRSGNWARWTALLICSEHKYPSGKGHLYLKLCRFVDVFIESMSLSNLHTCPGSGGAMRFCGKGGTALPHSLQKRAKGSLGRGAKQWMHLEVRQQFVGSCIHHTIWVKVQKTMSALVSVISNCGCMQKHPLLECFPPCLGIWTHFMKSVSLWSLIAWAEVSGGRYLAVLVAEKPFVVSWKSDSDNSLWGTQQTYARNHISRVHPDGWNKTQNFRCLFLVCSADNCMDIPFSYHHCCPPVGSILQAMVHVARTLPPVSVVYSVRQICKSDIDETHERKELFFRAKKMKKICKKAHLESPRPNGERPTRMGCCLFLTVHPTVGQGWGWVTASSQAPSVTWLHVIFLSGKGVVC